MRLGDDTFVHFASVEDGASSISALDAFRTFQSRIEERCLEQPQVGEATIVGNHQTPDE